MTLKDLPIGIQTFSDLITENYLYIDKTKHIHELIRAGKGVYFLSRPRRFGKSLTISTLEAIFSGQRELFKGLWLENSDWDWEVYPVIRLDMSVIPNNSVEEFKKGLNERIKNIAKQHQVELDDDSPAQTLLLQLIEALARNNNQVVVLVDEYDKPLLDNVDDPEIMVQIREVLKGFYGILKAQDKNLRFVFLTGVSKFSKVSIFSGLNNLEDITMTSTGAALLGYTQQELETYFQPYINKLAEEVNIAIDELLKKIKVWYNGYRFSHDNIPVYNPFSTLLLFKHQTFSHHWFASGTPTFLTKLIERTHFDIQQVENIRVMPAAFATYEVEDIQPLPILYQAGYLTIKDYDPKNDYYTLGYPNYEVKTAFIDTLLNSTSHITKAYQDSYLLEMQEALVVADFEKFFASLQRYFANIPYDLHISNEKYYQNVFYFLFTLLGLKIQAEVHTNLGRIDAVLELEKDVFIFELKVDKSAQEALNQIKERRYAEKYADRSSVSLIGVNINTKQRNIDDWLIEKL